VAHEPLETAQGGDFAGCRQLSVFLENRLGQLLRLTRIFEDGDVNILALSVEGSIDCAIVRLLVNDPDAAHKMLSDAGFPSSETEVVVVELPPGRRGIMVVCAALISGEININYLYPLIRGSDENPALAIQVDDLAGATNVLQARKFRVLQQFEL
jgi:hypothetical protein